MAESVGHPFESINNISDWSCPSTATNSRTNISYGPKEQKHSKKCVPRLQSVSASRGGQDRC